MASVRQIRLGIGDKLVDGVGDIICSRNSARFRRYSVSARRLAFYRMRIMSGKFAAEQSISAFAAPRPRQTTLATFHPGSKRKRGGFAASAGNAGASPSARHSSQPPRRRIQASGEEGSPALRQMQLEGYKEKSWHRSFLPFLYPIHFPDFIGLQQGKVDCLTTPSPICHPSHISSIPHQNSEHQTDPPTQSHSPAAIHAP